MAIWESLKIIDLLFSCGEVQCVGRIGDLSLSDVITQTGFIKIQCAGHASVRRGCVIFATCGFRPWAGRGWLFPLEDPSCE